MMAGHTAHTAQMPDLFRVGNVCGTPATSWLAADPSLMALIHGLGPDAAPAHAHAHAHAHARPHPHPHMHMHMHMHTPLASTAQTVPANPFASGEVVPDTDPDTAMADAFEDLVGGEPGEPVFNFFSNLFDKSPSPASSPSALLPPPPPSDADEEEEDEEDEEEDDGERLGHVRVKVERGAAGRKVAHKAPRHEHRSRPAGKTCGKRSQGKNAGHVSKYTPEERAVLSIVPQAVLRSSMEDFKEHKKLLTTALSPDQKKLLTKLRRRERAAVYSHRKRAAKKDMHAQVEEERDMYRDRTTVLEAENTRLRRELEQLQKRIS